MGYMCMYLNFQITHWRLVLQTNKNLVNDKCDICNEKKPIFCIERDTSDERMQSQLLFDKHCLYSWFYVYIYLENKLQVYLVSYLHFDV